MDILARLHSQLTLQLSMGTPFSPPANVVCEGYVFTPVCQSFCSQGGVCVVGVCGRGHVWWGTCVVGGTHGRGACMAGVCVWWEGVCMVGGVHDGGVCMADTTRYGQ